MPPTILRPFFSLSASVLLLPLYYLLNNSLCIESDFSFFLSLSLFFFIWRHEPWSSGSWQGLFSANAPSLPLFSSTSLCYQEILQLFSSQLLHEGLQLSYVWSAAKRHVPLFTVSVTICNHLCPCLFFITTPPTTQTYLYWVFSAHVSIIPVWLYSICLHLSIPDFEVEPVMTHHWNLVVFFYICIHLFCIYFMHVCSHVAWVPKRHKVSAFDEFIFMFPRAKLLHQFTVIQKKCFTELPPNAKVGLNAAKVILSRVDVTSVLVKWNSIASISHLQHCWLLKGKISGLNW